MSDLKIFTENVDYKALQQIFTLVKQDSFANSKIRIMPDVHAGAGILGNKLLNTIKMLQLM